MTIAKALLRVEQLEISCFDSGLWRPVVQDVSFHLCRGEMVALTGPSGCGKSVTAHALVGLLEPGWKATKGKVFYKEQNILDYDHKSWQQLRREDIALLIQQSLHGLNPIRTVKKQMVETLSQRKTGFTQKDRDAYLCALLQEVGFSDPDAVLSAYPFELSGGMRQRVLLAMTISLQPRILIADEPTTALDAVNRDRVFSLLKKLQRKHGLTILLISHDQQSVHRFADRIVKMERGGCVR